MSRISFRALTLRKVCSDNAVRQASVIEPGILLCVSRSLELDGKTLIGNLLRKELGKQWISGVAKMVNVLENSVLLG